jgi:hypothetical protein
MMVAMTCARTASAQTTIEVGAKAGVNIAKVSGVDNRGARIGGVVGGNVTLVFSDTTSLQPEVLYSQEGVKGTTGSTTIKANIDMVRVALLLRLGQRPAAGGAYVIFGPSAGFVTRARRSVTGQPDVDSKSDLRKGDGSIVFGGGYILGKILGEVRYTYGLTDLNNISTGQAQTTQVLSFLGGVRF